MEVELNWLRLQESELSMLCTCCFGLPWRPSGGYAIRPRTSVGRSLWMVLWHCGVQICKAGEEKRHGQQQGRSAVLGRSAAGLVRDYQPCLSKPTAHDRKQG